MKATILNLAINNIKSIRSAIEKICETKVISNKNEFTKTDIVILPGNGSFGKGIEEINKRGFDDVIKNSYFCGKKIIGICLGLQLMMRTSEESQEIKGLGLIDGVVSKINDESLRLPLLGWYDVKFKDDFFENKSYFFNNNYSVNLKDSRLVIGKFNNITSFIKQKNFYGFQFHPEKSGKHGIELLKKIILD